MADAPAGRLNLHNPLDGVFLPQGEGYRLEALPPALVAMVPLPEGEADAVARKLGFAAAPAMLRGIAAGGNALLRLGPEEALFLAENGVQAAETAENPAPRAIEISHGLIGLRLSGTQAEMLLATGCPIDVHSRAFPVGMSTRTLFGKFDLILWRIDEHQWHLWVVRSGVLAFLAYLGQVFAHAPVDEG